MEAYVSGAACLFWGYLIGNLQSAVILSQALLKKDVRSMGSGNAGTTNMLRSFGWKFGLVTFLLDLGKGALACYIGARLLDAPGCYLAGISVILGHNYPALFGFRGGKGVATTFGVMLFVDPLIAVAAGAVSILAALVTRYMSIGSMLGVLAMFGGVMLFRPGEPWLSGLVSAMLALVLFTHRNNIVKLVKGVENKLSFRKSRKKEDD